MSDKPDHPPPPWAKEDEPARTPSPRAEPAAPPAAAPGARSAVPDNRYDGKPLLRILELYVMDCAGLLPPDEAARMERMTPGLHKTFGREGTWQEIIAAQMAFPPEMPQVIAEMWESNQEKVRLVGQTLTAEDFARMFVDTNIDHDISEPPAAPPAAPPEQPIDPRAYDDRPEIPMEDDAPLEIERGNAFDDAPWEQDAPSAGPAHEPHRELSPAARAVLAPTPTAARRGGEGTPRLDRDAAEAADRASRMGVLVAEGGSGAIKRIGKFAAIGVAILLIGTVWNLFTTHTSISNAIQHRSIMGFDANILDYIEEVCEKDKIKLGPDGIQGWLNGRNRRWTIHVQVRCRAAFVIPYWKTFKFSNDLPLNGHVETHLTHFIGDQWTLDEDIITTYSLIGAEAQNKELMTELRSQVGPMP